MMWIEIQAFALPKDKVVLCGLNFDLSRWPIGLICLTFERYSLFILIPFSQAIFFIFKRCPFLQEKHKSDTVVAYGIGFVLQTICPPCCNKEQAYGEMLSSRSHVFSCVPSRSQAIYSLKLFIGLYVYSLIMLQFIRENIFYNMFSNWNYNAYN